VATSLSGATVGQALAGFIERRTGKGSHLLFVHPESGKEVWVTIHRHECRPARESHPAGCGS
jgi:predicted RNA binding protein YcfA (HicA-like mRNA interferase family)